MKVLCLFLVLCAAMTCQAEGDWWSRTVSWVAGAVRTVVGFIGKKHRRRALRELLDEDALDEVDSMCTDKHIDVLTVDGVPYEMVLETFKMVDEAGNPNEALDASELDTFLNALEVYQHCMNEQNGDA